MALPSRTPIEQATARVQSLARARAKVRQQLAHVKAEEQRIHRAYLEAHCILLRLQVERDEWALRSTEPYYVYDEPDEPDQVSVRDEPGGVELGDIRGPSPDYWLADIDSASGRVISGAEADPGQGGCAGHLPQEEEGDAGSS